MSIARHPLTIFLVVGVLLFVLDRWRSTESIIIDEAATERVAGLWETQMGTPPDSETLEALLAAWLREEIFYREALRRGLDADDTVVRRRLIQKLEFLVQDMTPGAVNDGDLEAYFEEHRERYRLPERWTFEQQQYATKAEAEAAPEAKDCPAAERTCPATLSANPKRNFSKRWAAPWRRRSARYRRTSGPAPWKAPSEATFCA